MFIYSLSIDEYDYDCCYGHIIVASSKSDALKMASKNHGDEGAEVWEKAKIKVLGKYTGQNKKPFIPLSAYNAG